MAMSGTRLSAMKSKLQSGAKTLSEKAKEKLNGGQLVKAKLIVTDGSSNLYAPVTVQFNPSEYSISRGLHLEEKKPLGQDPGTTPEQVTRGEPARLSVKLYFDTITDLYSYSLKYIGRSVSQNGAAALKGMANPAALKSLAKNQLLPAGSQDPATVCDALMSLVKYAHEGHTPPTVRFLWGKLDFSGRVESSSVQYTMFAPDGTPVKATVDLVICGEEQGLTQHMAQYPFQSPDRTKERVLREGDQLWMLAQQEYSDPAKWRVIAGANGILNPRRVESAVSLKVPSIK